MGHELVNDLRPRYMGQSLFSFLSDTMNKSPDSRVIFDWLAWERLPDGTMQPPSVSLGDLRKELYIRMAFPHQAETLVF